MLHLRPKLCLAGLFGTVDRMHGCELPFAGSDLPLHSAQVLIAGDLGAFMRPLVARVPINSVIIAAHEFVRLIQIMHIGSRPGNRVDVSASRVNPGVGASIPNYHWFPFLV